MQVILSYEWVWRDYNFPFRAVPGWHNRARALKITMYVHGKWDGRWEPFTSSSSSTSDGSAESARGGSIGINSFLGMHRPRFPSCPPLLDTRPRYRFPFTFEFVWRDLFPYGAVLPLHFWKRGGTPGRWHSTCLGSHCHCFAFHLPSDAGYVLRHDIKIRTFCNDWI